MDEYRANNARIEAEYAEKRKQEREKFLEENPQHKGLTPKESLAKLDQERREKTESDPNFQFRQAVRAASRGDKQAHQKMIKLLQVHGVDLIKDRRMMALKMAAELTNYDGVSSSKSGDMTSKDMTPSVMDVLLNALNLEKPEMYKLKSDLVEYVRSGRRF
jgi:hypothetical protein